MSTAPKTRKVRIQDLEPGMKVVRIDDDLNFVYPTVEKVVPQKVGSVTRSYKVYMAEDAHPDDEEIDKPLEHYPFLVRIRQSIDVLDET
jgi:hypothetical protein